MSKHRLIITIVMILALGSLQVTPAFAQIVAKPSQTPSGMTFDVLVGYENANKGVDVMAYFPHTVTIHKGDTIHWIQNSNEIHTVTFLAGADIVDFPLIVPAVAGAPAVLMFNPVDVFPDSPIDGMYDGTTFVNSGLMGLAEGQVKEFSLTFTEEGEFDYICLVHGEIMTGKIIVVPDDEQIKSPNQVAAQANKQIAKQLSMVSMVYKDAEAMIQEPVENMDGSMTYYVMLGYGEGQIMLMDFFPQHLVVKPGDTIEWWFPPDNETPHTVTFLNGATAPDLAVPYEDGGQFYLLINNEFLFPSNLGMSLTREGVYSSGLMNPLPPPAPLYTLEIGNIVGLVHYECMLHDESGMTGTITVVP
jgi:plastocyanin